MAKFDADDAHLTSTSLDHVLWLDFTDPMTGETTTVDIADAPVAGNGQTITITWDEHGFIGPPTVD